MSLLRSTLRSSSLTTPSSRFSHPTPSLQTRGIKFEPKKHRTRKSMKGRTPIRTGGSTVGTILGRDADYGCRVKAGVRLTAKQLQACYEVLRRKMKPFKGSKIFMTIFPDKPVCVKGNETRMGKGKGTFEYWAALVPMNHTLFELRGGNVRIEAARDAFRCVAAKIPVGLEFMRSTTGPKRGHEQLALPPRDPPTPTMDAVAEAIKSAHAAQQETAVKFDKPVSVQEKMARLREASQARLTAAAAQGAEGGLMVKETLLLKEKPGPVRSRAGVAAAVAAGLKSRRESPGGVQKRTQVVEPALLRHRNGGGEEEALATTM